MSIYLKYGQVQGDVEEAGHPNWIEILSVNWGMNRAGIFVKGGNPIDAPSFAGLQLTKMQDVASIPLIMQACEGTPADVQIDFCRTGSGNMEIYYSITMTEAVITSFSQGASQSDSNSSARPIDQLALDFTKISFAGTQMAADGGSASPVSYGWDVKARASS